MTAIPAIAVPESLTGRKAAPLLLAAAAFVILFANPLRLLASTRSWQEHATLC